MSALWGWISGFGRFWYGFIIGDDWTAAGGVLIMLGAAYGLLRLHVPAWWAGPAVITGTLLVTMIRAARRQRPAEDGAKGGNQGQGQDRAERPPADSADGEYRNEEAMDIVELILSDHHEQRRMFAILDEAGQDPARLGPVWRRLSILLEVHADAEERLFYPRLLEAGNGADGADSAREETTDAVRDHNDIRDGIRRADQYPVGSEDWWQAVTDARTANSDHMAEEEREALADFRRHASLQARHQLGIEFAVYEAAHAGGVPLADKDPGRYLEDHDARGRLRQGSSSERGS